MAQAAVRAAAVLTRLGAGPQGLQAQLKEMSGALKTHSDSQTEKSKALDEKEKRLHVRGALPSRQPPVTTSPRVPWPSQAYQFKIQQKQKFLEDLAGVLQGLNKTVPNVAIDADPFNEYVWDDDFEADGYKDEYYTGDDDWMNDEEWY